MHLNLLPITPRQEGASAPAQGSAAVFSILRHGSLYEARTHLRDAAMVLGVPTPANTGVVHDYWLALILLAGKKMQLTFKVFHTSSFCRGLLDVVAKGRDPAARGRLSRDVMREYCNRTAGYAKRVLGDKDVSLGLSLPLVTRGFDEIFNDKDNASDGKDVWSLCGRYGVAVCVAELQVGDWQDLPHFTWSPPESAAALNGGVVEFL